MPDTLLDHLSTSVTRARTLEELTRPLLEMLESLTGLESTYLTRIDLGEQQQHILYARNVSARMTIPEGLSVAWADTLCKRALDSDTPCTNEVSRLWGDSEAARALGIETYVSTPVRFGDGELYGTLCAASPSRHELDTHAQRALELFARLIGQFVEREHLLEQLLKVNAHLTQAALTDTLTSLPNRRALHENLERLLAQGRRQRACVLVAFVDLDGFKAINDQHGHEAGDAFLVAVGQRLRDALRGGDLAARLGGDEFVIIGMGPLVDEDTAKACDAFQRRIFDTILGVYTLSADTKLDYPGASVGVLAVQPGGLSSAEALHRADALMYEVKRARKTQRLA